MGITIFYFLKMIYVSLRDRVPAADDAWGTGRTLEWMTHTPVPFYNFAITPQVNALDELAWLASDAEPALHFTTGQLHL